MRAEVALAAWTRAVLLDNDAVADRVRPALADLLPDLRDELNGYRAAVDRADRRFAAAFALLRTPGAKPYLVAGVGRERPRGIDDFRDNWWCAPVGTKKPVEGPAASFLTAAERESLARERAKLRAIPTGPNYLATIAIDRALKTPRDDRVPEALHLAVRSTRFGCVDAATSRRSRQAFTILHEQYPKNPWTARTPYWF
ncbi:MAG: hypothetical protein DMD81_12495 [Candidatus Rokuibacteriota bacterium]|nr:MAG: hypothetical protein DMD81_12495 [Candidatus Rokubacteria bacterium]